MTTTYYELVGDMNEEVLGEFDDPADITAGTRAFLAKVDDFKRGSFGLVGGEATAVLDRHSAKVESQNRKAFQPATG